MQKVGNYDKAKSSFKTINICITYIVIFKGVGQACYAWNMHIQVTKISKSYKKESHLLQTRESSIAADFVYPRRLNGEIASYPKGDLIREADIHTRSKRHPKTNLV